MNSSKSERMEKLFFEWFKLQPQKNNQNKTYKESTINAAIRLLRDGLQKLKVPGYEVVNCFNITNVNTFENLYQDCYSAAKKYDDKEGMRDFRNGLEFYLEFLKEQSFGKPILEILKAYKNNFAQIDAEERYKWEAVAAFQKNWDIEADDIVSMLRVSFKGAGNLLTSGYYYAFGTLLEFAEANPEETRNLFIQLYDESLDFKVRYENFRKPIIKFFKEKNKNHYQDLHAISVYLSFKYPEKYYIYKYAVLNGMYSNINHQELKKLDSFSDVEKYSRYCSLCNLIKDYIHKDEELQNLSKNRLNDMCYQDSEYNLLATDIAYFGSNYKMNTFSWIPFYTVFADELLKYKNDRKALVNLIKQIYTNIGMNLPKLEEGDLFDIDPFTVYGLFNKGIKDENRIKIINGFKEALGITAETPKDFIGIPVLNNLKATFYWFLGHRKEQDIGNLWDIFEKALIYSASKTEENKERLITAYNTVIDQHGVSWNITMGLFWMRPYDYINLDSCSRTAFNENRMIPPTDNLIQPLIKNLPSGEDYFKIIDICNSAFKLNDGLNFPVLSHKAWETDAYVINFDTDGIVKAITKGDIMQTAINKNTILYGPPGTGKTYNTARYAVAIVENKPLEEIEKLEYQEVLRKYNEYKAQGRIEFTTFHQAFGYEEFIEGIKPVVESSDEDSNDIKYEIAPGLFKKFCDTATTPNINSNVDMGLNKNPTVWKVSLWSTGDNPIRTECIENGHIRVGWDEYGPDITSETDFSKAGGKKVLNSFIYKMKQGDIVLSCYSNTAVDAIGVVTSDYEWHEEYDYLKRLRKVNWLVKGKNENIVDMNNGKTFTLATVYKSNISVSDALSIVQKYSDYSEGVKSEKKNHVFIIDEINRGNISKIFGELITLIEPSKRVGASEELKAILPYSQKLFGVPDNVYILGTMNTADRSIAMLDTALRRRFDFVEMMPDADILKGVEVDGIDISKMLDMMNKRIEVLFDREHTIGHAYFIGLKDNNNIETLANIFKNKVIPLLQEYFYEDYEKIRLVLADNQAEDGEKQFIKIEDVKIKELFGKSDLDMLDDPKKYYINEEAFKNKDAYIKIYNN